MHIAKHDFVLNYSLLRLKHNVRTRKECDMQYSTRMQLVAERLDDIVTGVILFVFN